MVGPESVTLENETNNLIRDIIRTIWTIMVEEVYLIRRVSFVLLGNFSIPSNTVRRRVLRGHRRDWVMCV